MPEKETIRPRRAKRIKDARGRSVTQLDPVAMYLLHRHDAGIPHEELRELTSEIGIGKLSDSWLGILVGGIGFACALVLMINALTQLINGSILLAEFVRRAIWFQGIWALPLAFWKAARRARFHRIRRIMLEHLRCPHCGYYIRGLPTAPEDGATVCPECGCAWELPDSSMRGKHEDSSSDMSTTVLPAGDGRDGHE